MMTPNTPNVELDLQKLKIERNLLASLVKKLKNTETCLTLSDLQSEAKKLEIDRSGLACEIDRVNKLIEEERKKTTILKSVIKEKEGLHTETIYMKKDLTQKLTGQADRREEVTELRAKVKQRLFQVGSITKEHATLKRELEEKERQMTALTRQLLQLQSEVIFYRKERVQMDLLMNTEEEAKVILGRLRQANMEVEDQLTMVGRRVERMKAHFLHSGRGEVMRKSFAITGIVPESADLQVHKMSIPSEVSTAVGASGPGEPRSAPKYAMVHPTARVPSEYTISNEAIAISPLILAELITPHGDDITTIFTADRPITKSLPYEPDLKGLGNLPTSAVYCGEDEAEAYLSQMSSTSRLNLSAFIAADQVLHIHERYMAIADIHDKIIRLKRKMIDHGDLPLLRKRIEALSQMSIAAKGRQIK